MLPFDVATRFPPPATVRGFSPKDGTLFAIASERPGAPLFQVAVGPLPPPRPASPARPPLPPAAHPSAGLPARIEGPLGAWRAANPGACVANVMGRADIADDDLKYLAGIERVDLRGCKRITDFGLYHLRGVQILNAGNCPLITDGGLAHLRGVRELRLRDCAAVTGAGFAHLAGKCQLLDVRGLPASALVAAHNLGINTYC